MSPDGNLCRVQIPDTRWDGHWVDSGRQRSTGMMSDGPMHLTHPQVHGIAASVLITGDDPNAKNIVFAMAREMGFHPCTRDR